MTIYKITATRENGTEFSDTVCEASESMARKAFKEIYRHGKCTITGIEVIEENAPASREQERKALAQIKAIVATLGSNSYIATAFEGCFEIADENINNDFGCSMKQRADSATERATELEKKVAELEQKLKTAELNERDLRNTIKKVKDDASRTITVLKQQVLGEDEIEDIRQLVSNQEYEHNKAAENAAAEIVKYADNPNSKEFVDAVRLHRNYTKAAEYNRSLMQHIEAVQAAQHKSMQNIKTYNDCSQQ